MIIAGPVLLMLCLNFARIFMCDTQRWFLEYILGLLQDAESLGIDPPRGSSLWALDVQSCFRPSHVCETWVNYCDS